MSLVNAATIALLLILLTGLTATIATYLYVRSVSKKKTTAPPKAPQETDLNIQPRTLIEAQEVQSDGVLATSSTVIGVISLEVFARRHRPDCIIGVNRGGWLLSTYLAHRLNISRDKLLRFDASKADIIDNIDLLDKIYESDQMNILLVDDISRTGGSIQKAISCVKRRFSLSKLSVAVLVVCGRATDKNIDYNPYWTQHKDIQLPWSSDERKREARKIINAQGEVVQLGDQNSLDIKVPVLRIADSETKEGEGVDISNNDIETVINMLEKLLLIQEPPSTHSAS